MSSTQARRRCRRMSNELAGSVRLDQLRQLQSQLSELIKHDDKLDEDINIDDSYTSSLSTSSRERCISDGTSIGNDDIESGMITTVYRPQRHHQLSYDDVAPAPINPGESSTTSSVSPTSSDNSADENESISLSCRTTKTVSTSGSSSKYDTRPTLRRRSSSLFKKDTNGNRRSIRHLPTYEFLRKDNDKKEGRSLLPNGKWWHSVFLFSLISMIACILTLWLPYPFGARMNSEQVAAMGYSKGCQGVQTCICPRETICADDLLSMIFLTIARASAWFSYPLYMLLFLSKANNLNNFLQTTALRCWINFSDYHHVHSLFGIIVGFESTSHSFFHILRWARRNNDIQLLWTGQTGITGLIAIVVCPFIVLPMMVPFLKKRMSFELRKGLHYLRKVRCCVGCSFNVSCPQRIFWLIGVPLFIYTADKMVEVLLKTHLIESANFQRLGDTSCIISFENPPGFGKQNSAYVYLMLPWKVRVSEKIRVLSIKISKYEFHAFTVFPCSKPNHSSICIHACGGWTGKLMEAISTPTDKPAFIIGPYLSPFSSPAMDSENLVAVASGIGVTPAISLIKQYSSTSRRLNLVWICRDAGLIEHFLQNVEFSRDGYSLVYYTGDRQLILQEDMPPNVFIFTGRPNLTRTISGIISSISTGFGLPEELGQVLSRTPAEVRSKLLLEKALSIYTVDQLYEYTVNASNHYSGNLRPQVVASFEGVMSTMRHLLGSDFDLVKLEITRHFNKIDTEGDRQINRTDFEAFFNLMLTTDQNDSLVNIKRGLERMSTCRNMFESSADVKKSDSADEFGIKKTLQGDGKFSAKNWNMLYCGGSQPVLDQLKDFKHKFGIALSVEKFDW